MMFKQFILALCLSAMASLGQAQVPLKIITTDQPGGGMDALIRPVAEKARHGAGAAGDRGKQARRTRAALAGRPS
jgi:tripartite-type tricarboxylate transporter receptor subunit TctC